MSQEDFALLIGFVAVCVLIAVLIWNEHRFARRDRKPESYGRRRLP